MELSLEAKDLVVHLVGKMALYNCLRLVDAGRNIMHTLIAFRAMTVSQVLILYFISQWFDREAMPFVYDPGPSLTLCACMRACALITGQQRGPLAICGRG